MEFNESVNLKKEAPQYVGKNGVLLSPILIIKKLKIFYNDAPRLQGGAFSAPTGKEYIFCWDIYSLNF